MHSPLYDGVSFATLNRRFGVGRARCPSLMLRYRKACHEVSMSYHTVARKYIPCLPCLHLPQAEGHISSLWSIMANLIHASLRSRHTCNSISLSDPRSLPNRGLLQLRDRLGPALPPRPPDRRPEQEGRQHQRLVGRPLVPHKRILHPVPRSARRPRTHPTIHHNRLCLCLRHHQQ